MRYCSADHALFKRRLYSDLQRRTWLNPPQVTEPIVSCLGVWRIQSCLAQGREYPDRHPSKVSELLISVACFGVIALQSVSTRQSEMGEGRAPARIHTLITIEGRGVGGSRISATARIRPDSRVEQPALL